MITVDVPKKQMVRLTYDAAGTYPILYFSEDSVDVLKLTLHPDMAKRVRELLDTVGSEKK